MTIFTDHVDTSEFDTDFCIEDQDSSYYEDLSYLAQDCADYQLYVWGD